MQPLQNLPFCSSTLLQGLYCMLPTASEAVGRLTQHEAYIGYLPLAHVLEMLAEFTMLVLGVPIGYSTTNTLLDTSTMIARGCKVCVGTKVAINRKECTKAVFWAFPLATQQPIPCSIPAPWLPGVARYASL